MLTHELERKAIQSEDVAVAYTTVNPAIRKRAATHSVYRLVKRVFDIVLSLVALLILSPIFIVVAFLVKREDGGDVFYAAERVGQGGKKIRVLKFRSMKLNASKLQDLLTPEELVEYYKEYKLKEDPRITKIGNVLRKTSIDELPQLVNILKGDMSIVGPRPIVETELQEKYTSEQQKLLVSVKPGLTGAWQVYGRSDCTYESGIRQKVELEYIENYGIIQDCMIALKTVPVILFKVGAR